MSQSGPRTSMRKTRASTEILTTDILGVGVSAINMDDAIALIDRWVEERIPNYVCVTGVHGVMESRSDPRLFEIHNRAGLVCPDGMPLVWISHWRGAKRRRTRLRPGSHAGHQRSLFGARVSALLFWRCAWHS